MNKRPVTSDTLYIAGVPFTVIVSPHYMTAGLHILSFVPDNLADQIQAFVVEQTESDGYKVLPHPVRGEPLFTIENQGELFTACAKMVEQHKAKWESGTN